jgi:allantoinase
MRMDLVVRARRVVLPEETRAATIHVQSGRIAAVSAFDDVPQGAPVVDAGDALVLPGLVDTHVHVNEPGRTEWEGFETATRAAAAGGVTTIVDMPLNSVPPTTTLEGLLAKAETAEGKCTVDVAFCGGLVPGNVGELEKLFRAGAVGFKCFLAESGVPEFRHVTESDLRNSLPELARLGAPLLVHAELFDKELLPPGVSGPPLAVPQAGPGAPDDGADPRRYATYLASRPETAEMKAVQLLVQLCKDSGARAHVVHLSAAGALDLLRRAKDAHVSVGAETCPHYLTFAAEDIKDGATDHKCAPPIRGRANQAKLWDALKEGLIEQVVTDHSPSTAELKCSGSGDFMKAWGGISSLQLGLAATWAGASANGADPRDVVRWMAAAPAKLVGLQGRKGSIAPGLDADLVFWDPDAPFLVDAARLEHKNKITPYHRRTLRGRVRATFLSGSKIYEDGVFLGKPAGRWIKRSDA